MATVSEELETVAPLPDHRALRLSVVGAPAEDPSVVIEPGPDDAGPTMDGRPLSASVVRYDERRGLLRSVDETGATVVRRLVIGHAGSVPGRRAVARREVVVDGWRIEVEIQPARWAALRERATRADREHGPRGPTEVRAIIPGVVVSVAVAPGDDVAAGQQLLVIEAMKMQNELRAPRDGRVERVAVAAGTRVELGELLVVLG